MLLCHLSFGRLLLSSSQLTYLQHDMGLALQRRFTATCGIAPAVLPGVTSGRSDGVGGMERVMACLPSFLDYAGTRASVLRGAQQRKRCGLA
jgi:hypothetical protein